MRSSSRTDTFASPEFSAVDFVNRLFPDDASLTGVDSLIGKLKLRVRRVDHEILRAVRSQNTGGAKARADLQQAQTAILELNSRIRDIKSKAEQSEVMVQEICRDIKKLDCAKRHLTGTITALRRLSMLVSAVEQLETMALRRQYRDSANLLEAVNQLSTHFDGYNDIPKVAELQKKHAAIRQTLRSHVFEDFHSTWMPTVIEQDPGAAPRLADACLVVDALEPHVRDELVGNLTNKELMNYTSVFDGTIAGAHGDQSKLEAVDRRYVWIKRNLKAKEEMWGVFPPQWRVPQLLCMSLCKLTRTHLLEILDAGGGAHDVQTLLQALHRTIEFEREMDEHFGAGRDASGTAQASQPERASEETEALDGASAGEVRAKYERMRKEKEVSEQRGGRALPMDSAAASLAKASFRGVISGSFEDHLGPYVELEERQLLDQLDALVADETWGGASSAESGGVDSAVAKAKEGTAGEVLHSAGQVFLNIKKVFRRCSNLTRGKTLLALHGVFSRVLKVYAEKLKSRAVAAGKSLADLKTKKESADVVAEYRCLCLIVNTAEYCSDTVGPLGESMQRMLDVNLREQVNAGDTEDEFASLVTAALTTLVSGLEARTELVTGVTKINWGALELVGDQSGYVDACSAALLAAVPLVHATVSENYFRFFCEKFVGSVAPKLYSAVFRCKRFSDTGAQQLLLDVHAVKTLLLDLPTYTAAREAASVTGVGPVEKEKAAAVPASYTRLVIREMGKCEALLKVILSPQEGIAETFRALLPGGTAADFKLVCELKGMKKVEAAADAMARGRGVGGGASVNVGGGLGVGASAVGGAFSSSSAASSTSSGLGGMNLGGLGGVNMAGMNMNKFGSGMFKGMGSGANLSSMMDRAKGMTEKAASNMKEMGAKAADGTRKLMK